MDYKISVLIRTYNEQKHLGEVLRSLSRQTYHNYETIILDSGSTDDTLKIAQAYHARVEHIAKSEFNYSFASNQLVEYASGEVVCFLSGHSVPVRDTYLASINQNITRNSFFTITIHFNGISRTPINNANILQNDIFSITEQQCSFTGIANNRHIPQDDIRSSNPIRYIRCGVSIFVKRIHRLKEIIIK